MYTSASATGSTSSVSMVPGPVLSKSVRNELLPVSTSPAAGLAVPGGGLRSDGNELVIWLGVPSYTSRWRRRRMNMNAPRPNTMAPPMPASSSGLSMMSSSMPGGGGAAFFGVAGFGVAAVFGGSAGLAGAGVV